MDLGTYHLIYQPPSDSMTGLDAKVHLSVPGGATLYDMIAHLENFLKATGYVFDDKELVLERKAPDFSDFRPDDDDDFWGDDGVSLTGNPFNFSPPESLNYISSRLPGAMGEDHLSFRTDIPNFTSSVVTFS